MKQERGKNLLMAASPHPLNSLKLYKTNFDLLLVLLFQEEGMIIEEMLIKEEAPDHKTNEHLKVETEQEEMSVDQPHLPLHLLASLVVMVSVALPTRRQ